MFSSYLRPLSHTDSLVLLTVNAVHLGCQQNGAALATTNGLMNFNLRSNVTRGSSIEWSRPNAIIVALQKYARNTNLSDDRYLVNVPQ